MKPRSVRTNALTGLVLLVLLIGPAGCAQIRETTRLRVQVLEQPRQRLQPDGMGYKVSGKRVGMTFEARVSQMARCRRVVEQRALGFRHTTRRAEGGSLALEWVFGGLFTVAGGGIIAYTAGHPPPAEVDGEYSPNGQRTAYAYGAAIGVVGLALLAGATWQQLSLGVHETPLGERLLSRSGRPEACGKPKPASARVRLTLDDGLQLEADAGANGVATFNLPADIEQRLQAEGRRATLEVKGDWRSQLRIRL